MISDPTHMMKNKNNKPESSSSNLVSFFAFVLVSVDSSKAIDSVTPADFWATANFRFEHLNSTKKRIEIKITNPPTIRKRSLILLYKRSINSVAKSDLIWKNN